MSSEQEPQQQPSQAMEKTQETKTTEPDKLQPPQLEVDQSPAELVSPISQLPQSLQEKEESKTIEHSRQEAGIAHETTKPPLIEVSMAGQDQDSFKESVFSSKEDKQVSVKGELEKGEQTPVPLKNAEGLRIRENTANAPMASMPVTNRVTNSEAQGMSYNQKRGSNERLISDSYVDSSQDFSKEAPQLKRTFGGQKTFRAAKKSVNNSARQSTNQSQEVIKSNSNSKEASGPMNRMTEVLTKTIMDGHREAIIGHVIDAITSSEDYEEYIQDCIERVMNTLAVAPEKTPHKTANNALRECIQKLTIEFMQDADNPVEKRVRSLEQVLFKTSQADRNRLFDHIYERIKIVERKNAIEVDRLDKTMRRIEKRAEVINLQAETQREQTILTQNMCRQITSDLKKQSIKTKEWYDEFMSKVQMQNKHVIEELDRLRARVVTTETADINFEEKLGELFTQTQVQDKQLTNFDSWSNLMQEKLDHMSLEITKMKDLSDQQERSQKAINNLQQELEYNQNHYSLIENYVEKYMPITIQEAITSNLKTFIRPKDQQQLDYYIKSRRKELHGVILDNDEMPDVVLRMNAIRLELGRVPYPPRQLNNKDASNSDMQSSTFMQSNSLMSRQFFAFQGGKNRKRAKTRQPKRSPSNTETTSNDYGLAKQGGSKVWKVKAESSEVQQPTMVPQNSQKPIIHQGRQKLEGKMSSNDNNRPAALPYVSTKQNSISRGPSLDQMKNSGLTEDVQKNPMQITELQDELLPSGQASKNSKILSKNNLLRSLHQSQEQPALDRPNSNSESIIPPQDDNKETTSQNTLPSPSPLQQNADTSTQDLNATARNIQKRNSMVSVSKGLNDGHDHYIQSMLDGKQEIDPEQDIIMGGQNERIGINEGESVSEDDHDDNYSIDDSLINDMRAQIAEVEKEMKEQKQIMNSIMMIPKKNEYLIGEIKASLTKQIQDLGRESKSEVKELRDYIHTLHSEIQSSVVSIKKLKEQRPPSSQMVANMALEIAAVKRQLDEIFAKQRSQSNQKFTITMPVIDPTDVMTPQYPAQLGKLSTPKYGAVTSEYMRPMTTSAELNVQDGQDQDFTRQVSYEDQVTIGKRAGGSQSSSGQRISLAAAKNSQMIKSEMQGGRHQQRNNIASKTNKTQYSRPFFNQRNIMSQEHSKRTIKVNGNRTGRTATAAVDRNGVSSWNNATQIKGGTNSGSIANPYASHQSTQARGMHSSAQSFGESQESSDLIPIAIYNQSSQNQLEHQKSSPKQLASSSIEIRGMTSAYRRPPNQQQLSSQQLGITNSSYNSQSPLRRSGNNNIDMEPVLQPHLAMRNTMTSSSHIMKN